MSTQLELQERLNKATAVMKHCLKSEAAHKIPAMIDFARSELGISGLPDELDTNPWRLNCPNGTLDLQTGRLREHRREDMITKLCPTEYHAGATAPLWTAFMDSIFAKNTDLI